MKSLILILLLFTSISVMAGQERGNGGDVVVCRNSSGVIQSVELLDFYEARVLRGIQVNLGSSNLSAEQKLALGISRFKPINPTRAARFEKWAQEFNDDAIFLRNTELTDIPDSQHVAVPVGCKVEQIVIQQNPRFPQDKRYLINQDLLDHLSADGRAGLILHELIYRDALLGGATDSIAVRYLNSLAVSDTMKALTIRQYLALVLNEVRFPDLDYFGIIVQINGFDRNGTRPVKWGKIREDGSLSEGLIVAGTWATILGKRVELSGPIQTDFYDTGMMTTAHLKREERFTQGINSFTLFGGVIHLYENGVVKSVNGVEMPATFELPSGKKVKCIKWDFAIVFNPDGSFMYCDVHW